MVYSKWQYTGFFIFKIFVSWAYVYIHAHHINSGDIFLFLSDSSFIIDTLTTHPHHFVELIFSPNNRPIPEYLSYIIRDQLSFWQNTDRYTIVRVYTLLGLICKQNIYIISVFFSFLSFIGLYGFLKSFCFAYKKNISKWLIWSVFFTPSILFWTSSPHKESLTLCGIGMILYGLTKITYEKKQIFFSCVITAFGFLIVYFIRDYTCYLLLFSTFCFLSSFYIKTNKYLFVFIVFGLALFFTLSTLFNWIDVKQILFNKYLDFTLAKNGNTHIPSLALKNSWYSITKHIPQAFFNCLFRKSNKHWIIDLLIFLEGLSIILLFIGSILFKKKEGQSLWFFGVSFGLALICIIGIIVPNIGAISRYKSIAYAVLIPTLIFSIDFSYMKNYLKRGMLSIKTD